MSEKIVGTRKIPRQGQLTFSNWKRPSLIIRWEDKPTLRTSRGEGRGLAQRVIATRIDRLSLLKHLLSNYKTFMLAVPIWCTIANRSAISSETKKNAWYSIAQPPLPDDSRNFRLGLLIYQTNDLKRWAIKMSCQMSHQQCLNWKNEVEQTFRICLLGFYSQSKIRSGFFMRKING